MKLRSSLAFLVHWYHQDVHPVVFSCPWVPRHAFFSIYRGSPQPLAMRFTPCTRQTPSSAIVPRLHAAHTPQFVIRPCDCEVEPNINRKRYRLLRHRCNIRCLLPMYLLQLG